MQQIEKTNIEVKMTESLTPKIKFSSKINGLSNLGREIKISPKSYVSICDAGYKVEYFTEMISVCIGIGANHTAELTMTKEAWDALNEGEKISITTLKEFNNNYVKRK
jgi:hypothetical protein